MAPTDRLFEQDAYLTSGLAEVQEVTAEGIVLDRTIFYAESGGQVGDTGWLTPEAGDPIRVWDSQYLPGKLRIVHKISGNPDIHPGTSVRLALDWHHRYDLMRVHTALHVLCGLVDAPVTGCSINPGHGRIDFDLPENPFTAAGLDTAFQDVIARDLPLQTHWFQPTEAQEALADVRTVKLPPMTGGPVRVVEINGLDRQPCGGTHVARTGELEGLVVSKMQKKSKKARRITVEKNA